MLRVSKSLLCSPEDMIQFFSVVLSKNPLSNDDGPVEVYGYIAVRDEIDGMLNYIVNYVQQGRSGRGAAGLAHRNDWPQKRHRCGLHGSGRVRHEDQERGEDDRQLIDGAISQYHRSAYKPVKRRIVGDCGGAADMSFAAMDKAVEATIEVVVTSEVMSGLSLSLSCFVLDAADDYEEIQLFHGGVHQSEPLRRFVVAVSFYDPMLLEFKVGDGVERPDSRQVKFEASKLVGCASRQIKLKLASISVKVTWSTI